MNKYVTVLLISSLLLLNVNHRLTYAHEDPPHEMIELAYFKCEASKNLEGGIYGKGPFKRFGPEVSACSKQDWIRISHEEFRALATQWYGVNWDNEIPWWNREKEKSLPIDSVRYNFKDYLGKSIILEGKAVDAKVGALLVGDNFSIWIDGLDSWPEGFYHGGDKGKRLKVTGTVIEKFDLPVFVPKEDEPVIAGMPVPEGTNLHEASRRYLLKEATWEIIDEDD